MNIYIFGASEMGRKAYQGLMKHCNVMGFIDNDSQKWNKHFEDDLLIFPPDILVDSEEKFVVIIASTYFTEIADQLYGMGIDNFIGIPLESEYLSDDNFIKYLELSKKAYLFYKKIEKVQSEIDDIEISDYNKRYLLSKNIKEFYLYVDFIWNIFRFKNDVNTFIDYGGGSGTLAFFAKYIGIRGVYYNDIYDVSANDARLIADALDIQLKDYIVGDIEEVVKYCIEKQVKFDAVASYDVIEHIYKVEDYFDKLHFICSNDCVISMWTTANSYNPKVVDRLEQHHYKREYLGEEEVVGWKERDSLLPYVKIREKIIKEVLANTKISEQDLSRLVKDTREMDINDIKGHVEDFIETKTHPAIVTDKFATNTGDPYTGNWAERLIDYEDMFRELGDYDRKLLLPAAKENSQVLGIFIIGKSIQYKLEDMVNDRDQSMNRYMVYYNNLVQWISKINNGKTLNKWLGKQNYKNIIIYGAGQIGWIVYEQLREEKNINNILVCDSNKNSKIFEGIDVIGLEELKNFDTKDYLVIVTPIHVGSVIKKALKKEGISNTIAIDEIIREM